MEILRRTRGQESGNKTTCTKNSWRLLAMGNQRAVCHINKRGKMTVECVSEFFLKELCTNLFCEKWHPPECLCNKTKSGCNFGEKCSYAHRLVDEQRCKRSKKNDDKSAMTTVKKGGWQEKRNLLPTNVTIDLRNLVRGVIKSWDKIHLNVNLLMHNNWVAYFRT